MPFQATIQNAAPLLCVAFFLLPLCSAQAENSGAPNVYFQAHRGALDEMPENTLAAFRFAWGVPGAVPEVDIRTTSDGVLVCIHDETPRRTTNAPSPWDKTDIRKIPLETLRTWDAGSHFSPEYAAEKVPLLDEVFDLMQEDEKRQLYLDLKDVNIDALLEKIQTRKLEERVIFVHGDVEMCKKLQAMYPGARTMTWLSSTPQQQIERFESLRRDNFSGISQLQLHLRHIKLEPEIEYVHNSEYIMQAVEATRAAGVQLQLRPFAFSPQSLAQLVDLGVHWYVADAPKAFQDALTAGAKFSTPQN